MILWVFSILISISQASLTEVELLERFPDPTVHNGPNCYNTALISLGYMNEVVHVSPLEANFYLRHFCVEQSLEARQARAGMILVYESQHELVHMAYALGQERVFEKYNLMGSHQSSTRSPIRDGFHGDYFFHKMSDSVYAKLNPRVFQCQEESAVQRAMAQLQSKSWAQRLLKIRASLVRDLVTVSVDDLESYLGQNSLSYLRENLEVLASTHPANPIETEYLRALAYSNNQQIYFMIDGYYKIDCPQCSKAPMQAPLGLIQRFVEALNN